jgi:hypothetical protein
VRSAEDHGDAARTEACRQLVGARCGAGNDRDANDVGIDIVGNVGDALVNEGELWIEVRRRERRQRGERQRRVAQRPLENAAAMPVQRALWRDERNPQRCTTPFLLGPSIGPARAQSPDASLKKREEC